MINLDWRLMHKNYSMSTLRLGLAMCRRCCSTVASSSNGALKAESLTDPAFLHASDRSLRAFDPPFAGDLFRPQLTKSPALQPPIKNYTLATLVNDSDALQRLVNLGVDLCEMERKPGVARLMAHLDWDRDVVPTLTFLQEHVGMNVRLLGNYVTRNPWIFKQDADQLHKRLNYLIGKRFSKPAIAAICFKSRYWLNYDETEVDAQLGWFQQQFDLTGDQVRYLAVKEPRLINMGVGNTKVLLIRMREELGFTSGQLKQILLREPRVFLTPPRDLTRTFTILHRRMNLSLDSIASQPICLRCRPDTLSNRHAFLFSVYRAQYDPEKPNYVPVNLVATLDDRRFAERLAKVPVQEFDRFLMRQ